METHIQDEPVEKTKGPDLKKIIPFLWFDNQTEEAVNFYTSIFNNSKIKFVTHYSPDSARMSGKKEGSVMTISFQLEGQEFTAINGGPVFRINPAISFVVNCNTQEEIDYYWNKLSEGGLEEAQQCGWLADKFGVSWQIVPDVLGELLSGSDPARSGRVMQKILQMKKIDLKTLQLAYEQQ